MHSRVLHFLFTAAVFAAAASELAAETPPVIAFPAGRPFAGHEPIFGRGTPKAVVAAKLGMPSQVLSAGLWVYREFRTDYQDANQRGYDTLVVVFAEGRVQTMRVVNGDAFTALLAAEQKRLQASRLATTGGALPAPSMGYK